MMLRSMLMRGARAFARKGGPVVMGVVALCIIVYFAGPHLGLRSLATRLYIIGAILGIAVLALLVRWLWVRWRGKKLQSEMADQDDPKAAEREAEIQALREKMDEAIRSLKTSELGGGYRGAGALYALPWYMIIGPSAAGKSTLLCNSGLNFPYANGEDLHLRGFGGTRNCDWWFSDQAVILDTAGRYTTDDADREEWFTFLRMVKRHRKKVPLNGVIVAISVSDVLTADAAGLDRHVKIVRERIDELIREFGTVMPVYLVFTKCDLIKGFDTYFADLNESERAQVWGAYLLDETDDERPVEDRFGEHMEALYRRLCELRLHKLSRERNLGRKAELYDFPDQFLAASETLGEFVRLLFRSNPYQETPLLAGVYLTSSLQEGTPLQRALGGMRQAFGLASDTAADREGQQRAFFIRRLFTDVIFQLPGVVRRNRNRMLWGRWLKGAAVAAGLGFVGLSLLALSGSYAANRLLLSTGEERVAQVREVLTQGEADSLKRYTQIEKLYRFYERLRRYEGSRPWRLSLGMYSGDALLPAVERALFRALGREFRDPVLNDLEYRLETLARDWDSSQPEAQEQMRSDYHRALRAYLVSTRFPDRVNKGSTAPLMANLWARRLGLASSEETYEDVGERAPELLDMVRFYVERADREPAVRQWPIRTELVRQARVHLLTPPNAQRLYARIRHRGLGKLDSHNVDELLSVDNQGLLEGEYPLEGFYTADGWYEFTQGAIDDVVSEVSDRDWVLTRPVADSADQPTVPKSVDATEVSEELAAELKSKIRERYFADYSQHWLRFLSGVGPEPYESLARASRRLDKFARSDGPIGELMQVTADNVNLYERRLPDNKAAKKANNARSPVAGLEERLADLRRFTNPAEKKSTSNLIHQYLLLLGELKKVTERLSASADKARDAEKYAAKVLSGSSSDTKLYRSWVSTQSLLNGTQESTKKALKPLLTEPISELWRTVVKLARKRIQTRWRAQVESVYQSDLAGKFPFANSGPDANLDAVTGFFHPQAGKLWKFVNEDLSPYLERSAGGWSGRSWLGIDFGFSDAFLDGLREARVLTDALFPGGGSRPKVVFYLYPMPAGGSTAILLESNGQSYRYRNGPQQWRRFQWPGDMERIGARVAAQLSRGDTRAEREAESLWGLFHLLRDAEITPQQGDQVQVEWQLNAGSRGPVPVRFKIRADGSSALFQHSMLAHFDLPTQVFPGVSKGKGASVAEAD